MAVKELKSEGLMKSYEVEISTDSLTKMKKSRLAELALTLNVKGFRKGKAPMSVVEAQYGDAVMGEIVERAVNSESQKVINDNKLKPAIQPKIEVVSFEKGKPLVFTMEVQILPEFKVMDLKTIKLEKPVADVDDSVLEDSLKRIASQNSSSKPITTKRATKEGDIAVIDFDGSVDGEKRDGMKGEGFNLELGAGMFIPGFEGQLIGKKAGDEVTVNVTFPENYGAQELAGKDAVFEVKIHEIQEKTESTVDDDLAQKLGLEDLEALKKILREQMQSEYGQYTRMKLKRSLLDQLDEAHDFELPQMMVDQEYEAILRQTEHEKHHQMHAEGKDHDCDDMHVSDEEKAELKDIAHRRVKLGLVIAEIGNANKINVSQQDLQQAVMAEARKYPGQEAQVFEYYQKNQNALQSLRAPLFEEKTVDFILEQATVTEKKVSLEELTKEDDDEMPAKPKKTAAKKSSDKKPAAKKKSEDKK